MDDMKSAVLRKALGMLTVLGCKYAVIDPEGNKHGDLEVVPPKKKRGPPTMDYLPLFEARLKEVQPSDTIHEFVVPDNAKPANYRGALCGWCTRHWGRETYSTQLKDNKVLLMRYA